MKIILFSILTVAMIGLIIPGVFAEESEPTFEVTFDERDYKLEYENQIILPVKLKVSNHDYKITPEIFVRHEGKTVEHYTWPNIHSGDFTTYLLLDRNWSSGSYKVILKYDEKYLDQLNFSVSRTTDPVIQNEPVQAEKEKIETYLKLPDTEITIPDYPPSWFVMNPFPLPLDGVILYDVKGLYLHLTITDPSDKETLYKLHLLDNGKFETGILLDTTWPSGTYNIKAGVLDEILIDEEFTIYNSRIKNQKAELEQESLYESSILLSSQTAGNFQVLTVSGVSDAISEKLVILITLPDESIEEFDVDLANGAYSTDIVLYSNNNAWVSGKYLVSLALDNEILTSMKFEINESGNVVITKDFGSVISDSVGKLEELKKFDIGIYETDTFTISGKVNDYKTATKISISIVKPDKTKQDVTTLANSRGEYSIPILLDETWPKGEYAIYTTYGDFVDSPVSFYISGEEVADIIIDEITAVVTEKVEVEITPQIVSLPHGDGYVDLVFEGTTDLYKRFEKVPVILTMPDQTKKQILIRTNEGEFAVNISIRNSWDEGDYSFSIMKAGEEVKFGMFTVIDKNPNPAQYELVLPESAMPGSAYDPVDSFQLSDNKIEMIRWAVNYITFSGTVADKDLGNVIITVTKHDGSVEKLHPKLKRDNSFTGTININDSWSYGLYEIAAMQNDHEVERTEFLVTTTMQNAVSINEETSISEDMFLDSKGIELAISGKSLFGEMININLEKPDGTIEEFKTRPATKPSLAGDKTLYGEFEKKISVTKDWVAGTYKATAIQNNVKIGTALVHITPFSPTWLQDHTKHWVDGEISDWQYKNRLKTLAEHGILSLPDESDASTDFPPWLMTAAMLYADGETPQSSYLNSLQYLVDAGLLNTSE